MPVSFLAAAEREHFNSFPARLAADDIIAHFTLSRADHAQIPLTTTPANRLGFALHLSTLRFLGFYLPELTDVPSEVAGFVAVQLDIPAEQVKFYSDRIATRTTHQRMIENYLGFRHPSDDDLQQITDWLLMRALEHDRPIILLQLLCEHFLAERFVRPGFSVVERLVAAARNAAEIEIHQQLSPILNEVRTQWLDSLLDSPQPNRPSQLARLRESARSNSPKTILASLDKLKQLQQWRVGKFDLSVINPNRRKQLAQIGYRANNQTLQRMPKRKRHPVLLALLYQLHEEILDELVELFDRMLYQINRKTERRVSELKLEKAGLARDKIKLLQNLLAVVFDPSVTNENLRSQIYELFTEEQLRVAFDECREISEPADADYFEQLSKRYSYLRQFIPTFLKALPLDGNNETAGLREAVEILRELDASGKRRIPDDAPRDFIRANWWNQVFGENDKINRRFYELAVLFELRDSLRSGNIWVEGSRRYNKIESYLIPADQWNESRPAVCELLRLPAYGSLRLRQRQMELEALFEQLDCSFEPQQNGSAVSDKFVSAGHIKKFRQPRLVKKSDLLNHPAAVNIRLENGELVFSKLPGEARPDSSLALEQMVSERLPEVELTDILIEVDAWTKFSAHFEHPSGNEPRSKDALSYGYASVLAQACNFGLAQMSRMSGFSYRQLAWHTKWYLREETLKAGFTTLVNFHNSLSLAKVWGGGTLSSSDGQRFPVAVKTRNAVALPKYFGYGKGLTYYTWTSDQYSQFGTKVIPSTVRDATYVLDEILDNETELTILEHTTDTAGYTDLVFGLFDLLGLQFSPRLADLADQKLFGVDSSIKYRNIQNLISGKIKIDLILRHWDELLRIAGSLKQGFVTASLLISKLQSYPKQNALMRALQEYGKLQKTIFILKYLQSPEYQKKITMQLNKGEAMHALRTFLFVANERQIRKRNQEEQLDQAACLNLLANAVAVWNTVYLQAVLDELRLEGYQFSEEDVRNLSPARSEHINVYGKYYFNVEEGLQRTGLRELRRPEKDSLRLAP